MNAVSYIIDGGSGYQIANARAVALLRFLMAHPNIVHSRADLATAIDCAMGRSVDTYMSQIRRALGPLRVRLASQCRMGYAWFGEPVRLVQGTVRHPAKTVCPQGYVELAVMSQKEVARLLNMKISDVRLIERKALAKLSRHAELKDVWRNMLREQQRCAYDPFHEIWLYAVQERFPKFGVKEKERTVKAKL